MLRFSLFLLLLAASLRLTAKDPYEQYIDRWARLAMEHQEQYGIPASITLAQGLHESGAGRSSLATKANNHFGIKCHKDWKGKSVRRNDDAPNECFRAYPTPEESFRDHSLFLKGKRYSRLFSLSAGDYQGWAKGLRECGYATDPNYAARLVTIIERYSLYLYDTPGNADTEATAAYIRDMLVKSHPVRRARGLHYVVATPGDTYKSIAREFHISPKKLYKFNDVKGDGEITPWQEVYLEEKLDTPPEGMESATIGEDETMHSLSQRFGMKLEKIRQLNKKVKDEAGNVIKLR